MTKTRSLIALLTLVVVAQAAIAVAQSKDTPLAEGRHALSVQGERYGTLPDDHPITIQARTIFDKIARAAGRRTGVVMELYVVDTPRIVAEAMLGGLVIVSRGFVDLARGDANAMAFILGHEIAHVVRDHHGLLDTLGMLGTTTGAGPMSTEQVRAYQSVELEADRLGVLYAALAGYDVSAAVPMLTTLTSRVGPDRFHPSPKDRSAAVRDQIAEVAEHLEVFHVGLYLLSAGRYFESARVLEHFLSLFPSREVLSAVGVGYHREALRYAPAREFKHLLVIDPATRAPKARTPGVNPYFKAMMERAIHYYKLAVEADPAYAPAANNLGAAYLDLGERDLALALIVRAIKADARLASAYNNRALVWLEEKDYRRGEDDLLAAAKLNPELREVALNLSRLYEIQSRADDARRWADRARVLDDRRMVAGSFTPPGAITINLAEWRADQTVRRIRIPLGVSAGGDLTLLISRARGLAVLVRNETVEAVGVLASAPLGLQGVRPGDTPARVESTLGRPASLDGFQSVNVWSYPSRPLAVFVVNERVQTVWEGRPRTREDGDSRR
jgi:tetratricopeptide (TPR) repeat protein